MDKVDFSYAFGAPHVLTLSKPSGKDKTIVLADKKGLDIRWTWQNLGDKYPLSWTIMKMDVTSALTVFIDGEKAEFSSWERAGFIPELKAKGRCKDADFEVLGISGENGIYFKLSVKNNGKSAVAAAFNLEHTNGWIVSNKGWGDGVNSNILLAGQDGRADRILFFGKGADSYPIIKDGVNTISGVPMSNVQYGQAGNPAKTMVSVINAAPGESKCAYILRPFDSYFPDSGTLKALDFESEIEKGRLEWTQLLERGAEIDIPDKEVLRCYKSCLADMFVMREPLSNGYTGASPGTDIYRSANSGEGAMTAMFFDCIGYKTEAALDLRVFLDVQDDDGCWCGSGCWEHDMWFIIYYKAQIVMSHYFLTKDKSFLKKYYENMKKSSLWNYRMREKEKKDKDSPSYGLMPRGMGDGGVMNNSDYYGYFYPHNCMALAADGMTIEAAKILGLDDDIPLLEKIYETAKTDLLNSIRKYSIKEDGYEWIPATFNAAQTSFFGCLNAYYPCSLLSKEDPLISGTLKHLENKNISKGGLPLGMGWMLDGLWVAMALDCMSATYLRMGEYDKAAKYLYPVLNHASPFITWCEERGPEAGSTHKTGDWQHLWTPLSVCRFMRDSLLMEDGNILHICAGTQRDWLLSGNRIAVSRAPTYFGDIDFCLERNGSRLNFNFTSSDKADKELALHIRIPEKNGSFSLKEVSGCTAETDGETLYLKGVKDKCCIMLDIE